MKATTFLMLAVAAIILAGCTHLGAPADSAPSPTESQPQESEIYYLHLYSTLYDIYVAACDYGESKNRKLKENQCLATIAISPGVEFYANLPNHYEPSMNLKGMVSGGRDSLHGELTIFVEGVDVAYMYEHDGPIPVEVLVRLDEEPFHFAISEASDPYTLDYKRNKLK